MKNVSLIAQHVGETQGTSIDVKRDESTSHKMKGPV